MTRSPRARAPRAISTGTAVVPPAEKTISTSCGPNVKFDEDDLGEARRPLDEHRLALAVGADDLGVERHRQLDHRVEAGIRAVAREHLLDRDPRVAGPEQVDEPVGGDRVGAPLARLLDRVGLGRREPLEQRRRASSSQASARRRRGRRHAAAGDRRGRDRLPSGRSASSGRRRRGSR